MSRLYLVRGLPGSGKSTIASALAGSVEGGAAVEADAFFVDDDGVYTFDAKQLAAARASSEDGARSAMEAGAPVVAVANTFSRRASWAPYVKAANANNYSVTILETHGDHGSIHEVPDEAIAAMADRWESVVAPDEGGDARAWLNRALEGRCRESRTVARAVEVRVTGDDRSPAGGDPGTEIAGYAALFNTPATIAEQFIEVIDEGAFDDTIGDDIRVLFNHDPNQLLGRTKSGTASIAVDADGLRYTVTPPATQVGRDVLALVQRGDVDGSSFGFRVLEDRWAPGATAGDLPVRHVQRVALLDVSPVTIPAYSETTAEVRDQAAAVGAGVRAAEAAAVAALAARRLAYAKTRATEHI